MRPNRRQFLAAGMSGALTGAARPFDAFALAREPVQPSPWLGRFPALNQLVGGQRLTYLDSAATTLRPQGVIDALVEFYTTDNANPSPVHALAARSAQRLRVARETVARFINAAASEVIFVRGTTEGINLIASTWGAANLRAGDEVLLTVAEHNSNLLPWTRAARQVEARVNILDVDDEGRLRIDQFKSLLSKRTRVVAFSHVSNVLGFVNPVREMSALARAAGATVVVDGAQAAPHVHVDVRDLGCDFYVFSGHKMLGPMGTGVVWGRQDLLDAMPPYHVGSNMAHEADFERATFEHGALKFQAGTPDVAGPVGLAAAIGLLAEAGHDALWKHGQELVQHGLARLRAMPKLRIIGPLRAENRIPVFTFAIEGQSPTAIARALDQRGIAIRAGDMAALPLLKRFGVTEAARASAYVYSTPDDIDRLADALASLS